MSGKGSGRRPAQVDDHVLSNNWAGSLGAKPFEVVRIVGDIPVWCNGIEHEATKDKPEHPLDRTICDCEIRQTSRA